MTVRYSPYGIPYLADASEPAPASPPSRPVPLWRRLILFLAVFVALQALWTGCRGNIVERFLVDTATVQPAAALVRLLTPEVSVVAAGTRLTAPGGGINILNGCEGTETLFLLAAAFAVAGMTWRQRLAGLALGTALVYVLNQGRIVALFYSYRLDRSLFEQLHGTLGPLVLIILVGIYFFAWLQWTERHDAGPAA